MQEPHTSGPLRPVFAAGLIDRLLPGALILLAFFSCLSGSFLNLDDQEMIFQNPLLEGSLWAGVRQVFTTTKLNIYQPLNVLSLGLEARWFGFDPFVLRLMNVLWHLVNTALAFEICRQLGLRRSGCWVAALLFGLHPTRTEAVAWITSRKDLLGGFFILAGVLFHLRHRRAPSGLLRLAVFACGVLSMLSKPTTLSFPFLLWLCDAHGFGMTAAVSLRGLWPEFLLVFVGPFLHRFLVPPDKLAFLAMISLPWRLFLAQAGIGTLIRFLLFPFDLPVTILAPSGPEALLTAGSFLAALFPLPLLVLLWKAPIRSRSGFAAWWFAAGMIPIIGARVMAHLTYELTALRYLYLPALGGFFLFGHLAGSWLENLQHPRRRWLTAVGVTGILIWCGWQTAGLAPIWGDRQAFWTRAVRQFPASRTFYNLGRVHLVAGEAAAARACFQEARNRYSPSAVLWNGVSLGEILFHTSVASWNLGNRAEAAATLQEALQVDPRLATLHDLQGMRLTEEGRLDEALSCFDHALELDPSLLTALNNRAHVLAELQRPMEALRDLKKARARSREHPAVMANLVRVLRTLGHGEEAAEVERKAAQAASAAMDLDTAF